MACRMVLKSSTMSWMADGDTMGLPNAWCCQSMRAMACRTKHSLADVMPMDLMRRASMLMESPWTPWLMTSQSSDVRYGMKSMTLCPEEVSRKWPPALVFNVSMASFNVCLMLLSCMELAFSSMDMMPADVQWAAPLMRAMRAWVMAWSTWLSGDVMDSWSKCPISPMKSSIVQC